MPRILPSAPIRRQALAAPASARMARSRWRRCCVSRRMPRPRLDAVRAIVGDAGRRQRLDGRRDLASFLRGFIADDSYQLRKRLDPAHRTAQRTGRPAQSLVTLGM